VRLDKKIFVFCEIERLDGNLLGHRDALAKALRVGTQRANA